MIERIPIKRYILCEDLYLTRDDVIKNILEEYPNLDPSNISERRIESELQFNRDETWQQFKTDMSYFISTEYPIIAFGKIGRWDGPHKGYKFIHTFADLEFIWEDCNTPIVWDENGRLFIEAHHHDGCNLFEIKRLTSSGYRMLSRVTDIDEINRLLLESQYALYPHYAGKVLGLSPRAFNVVEVPTCVFTDKSTS